MSLRNRSVLMVVLSALVVLAGCSSTNKAAPPPTGGFGDTSLSGTYVFSTSGLDNTLNGDVPELLTMVGTFTACGCTAETISAGVVDVNDPNLSAPLIQDAVTAGTYSVGVDGRGKITLTLATGLPFPSPQITLDFVLSSTAGGVVTEFDENGSGSGTLDLQSSPAQTAGTYVFNLAGIAGVSTTNQAGIPLATVGSVVLDGSGNATGVQDLNNAGAWAGLTITSPSTLLVGTSPTTASFTTGNGTFNFDVYAISSTHFKLIETDAEPILEGDVYTQSTPNFPSGELAFTMVGVEAAGPAPLAVGGMMNVSGTTISSGVEDYNDGGASNVTLTSNPQVLTPISFTGGVAAGGTGRYIVTFNSGFENGNSGNTTVPYTFAAYPSSGGTQLLEIDGLGITGGAAYPQTNQSFASGQGYGLNLTGSNQSSEEDDIAEFTNTNNSLSGLIDVNDEGSTSNPGNFTGAYAADSSNPGRGIITTTQGGVNLTSYTLDGTNSIFIEIDGYQVAVGSIGQQAAQSQGAIAMRMAALRPRVVARGASKKRKAIGEQN